MSFIRTRDFPYDYTTRQQQRAVSYDRVGWLPSFSFPQLVSKRLSRIQSTLFQLTVLSRCCCCCCCWRACRVIGDRPETSTPSNTSFIDWDGLSTGTTIRLQRMFHVSELEAERVITTSSTRTTTPLDEVKRKKTTIDRVGKRERECRIVDWNVLGRLRWRRGES